MCIMEVTYSLILLQQLWHSNTQAIVRQKRNIYDPSIPSFPNANFPFFQPWPYPVAKPAPSPFAPFMPKPPDEFSNPFLKQMNEGYNPNYGFGLHVSSPTMIGGSLQYPSDDIMQSKDTVSGTFVRTSTSQLRFGTQGGTLFPWMDKRHPNAVRAAAYIGQAGNFQVSGNRGNEDNFRQST